MKNAIAPIQLPLICHAHGVATASTSSHGSVTATVESKTFTFTVAAARDLSKALNACLARLDRLTRDTAKKPDPTPTAPPSGSTTPTRLAA